MLTLDDSFAYFSLSAADVPHGPAQIFESAISDLQGEYVSSATYYAEETNLVLLPPNPPRRSVLTFEQWQYNFQYGTLDAIWVESTGNIVYASTVATSGEIYFTGNATEFISLYGGEEYVSSLAYQYNLERSADGYHSSSRSRQLTLHRRHKRGLSLYLTVRLEYPAHVYSGRILHCRSRTRYRAVLDQRGGRIVVAASAVYRPT